VSRRQFAIADGEHRASPRREEGAAHRAEWSRSRRNAQAPGGDYTAMSTATDIGATDGLHALGLLVTYPARRWLASRTPPPRPGRRPAAIHYFSS